LGGFLIRFLAAHREPVPSVKPAEPAPIRCEDHKARHHYALVAAQVRSDEYAHALSWVVARVNFAQRWLPRELASSSALLRRLRLMTAFHSLSGLAKLSSVASRGEPLRDLASDVLKSKGARVLRKLDKVRDLAAHYTLE